MNVMKKSLTALALAGLLGMTACSAEAAKGEAANTPATETATASSEPTESSSAPSKPKESSSASPSASETKSKDLQDELAAFGEEWTYEDGLTVKVSYLGGATASQYASGAEATGGQLRLFEVSITNNSGEIFDPAMFNASVNYGAEGTAGKRVFDTGSGLEGQFQGKILPGGTQTVKMGYAVPNDAPLDLLVTTSPSWDHEEKLFHGEAVKP
ncbi:hypothetical protein [Arthrobacter sunyaminii]|uniref:DUF4352 domain-containing protein n=1 Tax=Arthrobacter sunyaminii TaxID=2816859 RepID=A0A975S4J5_9MICC|nr:hypothetical protein [Arthrobacter sunyaminii]MBO0907075.1 hypothetical protein [Arthrobacter sunyaminii]QWQ34706.1 hypothetical protein KG104_08980 [Arthrobacter sunyaminii]